MTATPDLDGDYKNTPELKCTDPLDCAPPLKPRPSARVLTPRAAQVPTNVRFYKELPETAWAPPPCML